ncbi:MAG TPA: DUF72 domain-containing protein [Candidatus Methylomirabilis sp.]|nr:DUF72 domain-containing protein [Candidatus Methylomirabilis sp.]
MRRAEYYSLFPVVEIQQTFYNLPRIQTAERWRQEALAARPPGGREPFEFSLKVWQLITHEPSSPTYRRLRKPIPENQQERYGSFRPTEAVLQAWADTAAVARALGARVLVFQCPPRFTPTLEHVANLRNFFGSADRTGFVMAWEPRGDWSPTLVRDLCQELDLVHVGDPLQMLPLNTGLRYFRLHGLTGYRYLHTDADLEALAEHSAAEVPTYVLFNNLFMGEDAQRFMRLLSQRTPQMADSSRERRK